MFLPIDLRGERPRVDLETFLHGGVVTHFIAAKVLDDEFGVVDTDALRRR